MARVSKDMLKLHLLSINLVYDSMFESQTP